MRIPLGAAALRVCGVINHFSGFIIIKGGDSILIGAKCFVTPLHEFGANR